MARVVLKNVSKQFSGQHQAAVNNISLTCEDKEFIVLVGPSGCGKSTTLRLIAGLEEVTEGEIFIGEKLVNDVPPKDRDIAMVFQNYALYPHMTVYDNMAFGLKLNKFPQSEIKARVMEAAEILGIKDRLQRKPRQLSGGERQRVALGRAIVRKPKVFLFDEPLSNLDAAKRVQMRAEISKLHTRLQSTMIYVTHDQVEAMTMGDRIVVMRDGFIQQIADPITLYDQPSNKFVASFMGSPSMNFFEGSIVKKKENLYFSEENFLVRLAENHSAALEAHAGEEVIMGIRPEDIYDRAFYPAASTENTITATVEVVEPMGAEAYLYCTTGKTPFIGRIDSYEQLEVNQDIDLVFDMTKAHFFDRQNEQTIV